MGRRTDSIGLGVAGLLLALVALGCVADDSADGELAAALIVPDTAPEPIAASVKADLQWKRRWALQADLAAALELPVDGLCTELGVASCIHDVHRVALGGSDPLGAGLFRPMPAPLTTTSLALERVLLSACAARVAADRAGPAVVFSALDLSGSAPAPTDDAVAQTIIDMYRRLLARDPSAEEVSLLGQLATDGAGQPVAAADFATLTCMAVGTTTEFLFF